MNLQIVTVVNGVQEYIELFGDESITLEVSFAEIQDITKKNSTYTKEFDVPGSNQNNYIFNYFFDFNQVPLDWVPSRKFEAWILYNGYIVAAGYIRLNSVTIDREVKTYNVTFYNGVGDVAATIGDKFMYQLDLSHLSHPFDQNVYLQSQLDYNLFNLLSTTNYSYQNGKTFWGLYNIGYNYTNSLSGISSFYTGTSSTSLTIDGAFKSITTTPALPFLAGETIRLTNGTSGNYIQGIVQSATGTTITFLPNLGLGTGTYSSWNISRVLTDGLQINDPNTTPILEFESSTIPNYMSFSGTPVRNYYFKPSIQVRELYEQIFEQSGYLVESNFFNTSYFERYYLPLKFLDETVYTKGALQPCYTFSFSSNTPNSGVTCNNIPFSADSNSILITSPYAGTYTFEVFVQLDLTFVACPGSSPYTLDLDVNGIPYNVATISDCDEYPGTYSIGIGGTVTIPLTGDSVITIVTPIGGTNITLVEFQIINAPRFIVGNFDYSSEFPDNDFKQIDFITSINKMFNLVCIPHPTKENTIIVEPVIDYVGKGDVLDWTDKVDWDSPIQVLPTSTFVNGTLNYNFKLDKDWVNQQFNISSNRIFGTYELQTNQDYKDAVTNFETIFSSPVDTTIGNNNAPYMTISQMSALKTDNVQGRAIQLYNPYKIIPRIIFRGLTIPNQNFGLSSTGLQTWWAESYEIDRWQETNRFTTYPFSYTGFSHYINFNSENTFDPLESTFPTQQDLYDIYYYDYISDLTSIESKTVSMKMYLTPWEISNLKFNEKILIKNAYYRINKINNFNLTEPSLCDVQLVKFTKSYTSHPVKYLKLESCSSGSTLYTNSDLNYNLYAYVNRFVKIYNYSGGSLGCYEVLEDEQRSNVVYDHYYIGSGYTSSGVGVYADCNCTGATSFELVQQNYLST